MAIERPEQTGEKYEDTVRDMITREDQLTNQRMLWMATCNGLLFAALGFAWDKRGAAFLTTIFSLLGVSASFLNGLALIFASNAQRRLLQWWHSRMPKGYSGPGVMGCEPLDRKRYSLYVTPWILLSFLFTAGWLAIFLFVLKRAR
jgi:lysylphosphatidylglycerol synthetase-like protein (DUF2156 family)